MKKKMFRQTGKRLWAIGMSLIMTVSLAACGKGEENTSQTQQEMKEFIYVPEYITLDEDTTGGLGNILLSGNSLFYTKYGWDDETQTSSVSLVNYSLQDDSKTEVPVELSENQNVNSMTLDQDGNFYLYISAYSMEEDGSGNQLILRKCDPQGTVLWEQDITEAMNPNGEPIYISGIAVDGQGNIYANGDRGVSLFDASGAPSGMIPIENGYVQQMLMGKDGKMYLVWDDYSSSNYAAKLSEIDFAGKKLGTSYSNLPGNNLRSVAPGGEKDFLINNGIMVSEYDMASQTCEEVLTWLDSDINGDYVQFAGMLEDGRILAVISDWNTGKQEIARMTRTKASELPQKEEIVFGTLYNDQAIQAAAVAFNKKSDQYHISIKTYIDESNMSETSYDDAQTKLNNDITSGADCPDILDLSQLNNGAQLTEKGLFEDLYPYMEKSSILHKEAFLENVLEQFTVDGKLLAIPKTFNLETVVGKTSVVGDEMGWTLEEMKACAEKYPEAELFEDMSKSMILYYCLMYNQDAFVNWETGECSFDTEEFKSILEFVNTFPSEIDWENSDGVSSAEKLSSDQVLLYNTYISDVQDIQVNPAMFGEDVTYIGFPIMEEGRVGCVLNSGSRYAITAKSENKEGAWAFIEHYLTDDSADMYSWGFPTLKAEFDQEMEEATTPPEAVADEEGGASVAVMSSMSMDGWEYTFHTPTKEDAEIVRKLIEVATLPSSVNGELITIIQEEAEPYLQGQKSLDKVAGIIQSRAEIYVSENS